MAVAESITTISHTNAQVRSFISELGDSQPILSAAGEAVETIGDMIYRHDQDLGVKLEDNQLTGLCLALKVIGHWICQVSLDAEIQADVPAPKNS